MKVHVITKSTPPHSSRIFLPDPHFSDALFAPENTGIPETERGGLTGDAGYSNKSTATT